MKIYTPCADCVTENPEMPVTEYPVDVPEDGIVELTCEHRHETLVLLYADKYGLLFDSGASALADGYPREAVASFAASVERFYEHVTKVLLMAAGAETSVIKAVWKGVASQSERQLGAFRFTYLMEFKTAAPEIPQKWVEFRNDVIHKGRFPTADDALGYGELCLLHMREILDSLQDRHRDAIRTLLDDKAEELRIAALSRDAAKGPKGGETVKRRHMSLVRNSLVDRVNAAGRRQSVADWLSDEQRHKFARDRWRAWQMVKQIHDEIGAG